MTIAATRMHRGLVDFASSSTEVYDIPHFLSCFHAQFGVCYFRSRENRPLSSLVFSKTKRTDPAPNTLDRIMVSMNGAFERRSGGSKNDGDSSTVLSTSDKIPQITADPSEPDPHPLPTVFPSPVLQAESA